MRRLLRLVTEMDARAWRAVLVSFLLFGGVGVVFVFGASLLGIDGAEEVEQWMGAGLPAAWALPAAIGSFAALAFLGVPQFVLIAAAVVAFGPVAGFTYSWIGTLVSSVIGFFVGRRIGARALRDASGPGVVRFMEMVGRNGFVASLVVRLVPSAPFIVVNMAAGVTPMRLTHFVAGTAIGIVPKIALTAFAGRQVVQALHGEGSLALWGGIAAAAAIWIAVTLIARAWIKRREAARNLDTANGSDDPV
jgi:uncharacterized membrane protein YdjX (TVP38/TMEM64 family)